MVPEPITREEMYLAAIAGEAVIPPEPITRIEMYLDAILKSGGGTGEGDMKKSVYDSDLSVANAGGIKEFAQEKLTWNGNYLVI